jgi:hypothetical protein
MAEALLPGAPAARAAHQMTVVAKVRSASKAMPARADGTMVIVRDRRNAVGGAGGGGSGDGGNGLGGGGGEDPLIALRCVG